MANANRSIEQPPAEVEVVELTPQQVRAKAFVEALRPAHHRQAAVPYASFEVNSNDLEAAVVALLEEQAKLRAREDSVVRERSRGRDRGAEQAPRGETP